MIGVLGGVLGTVASIKNTRGPMGRAFVLRAAALTRVGMILFLFAPWLVPNSYRILLFVPYALVLIYAIRRGNTEQSRIRALEAGTSAQPEGEFRLGR